MKPYVYHGVEIVDFKAQPEQITYILAAGGKGFFVLSSDVSRRQVVERHTTLGRLLDKDWRRGNELNQNFPEVRFPYKGFFSINASSDICAVEGRIFEGRNNYKLENENPTNDKLSEIASLFSKRLLQQLEHYIVPEEMANKVRGCVETK